MAIARSFIFGEISGSVGDVTYQGGHHHAIIMKSKIVSPNYPDSAGQQLAKAALQYALTQWAALSEATREQWTSYARSLKSRRDIGRSNLTGQQAFVKIISFAYLCNQTHSLPATISIDPPVIPGVIPTPYVEQVGASGITDPTVRLRITNNHNETIETYLVNSDPQPDTRNKWSSPFLFSSNYVQQTATTNNVIFTFVGAPSNSVVFFKCRSIQRDGPHRVSRAFIFRAVMQYP